MNIGFFFTNTHSPFYKKKEKFKRNPPTRKTGNRNSDVPNKYLYQKAVLWAGGARKWIAPSSVMAT